MKNCSLCVFLLLVLPVGLRAQLRFTGRVIDSASSASLAYVNMGVRDKNIGTLTKQDGSFSLHVPREYAADTLSFSLVGYHDYEVALSALSTDTEQVITLVRKDIALDEVEILARQPVERRFGIKRRNLLIHFADGMFNKDDSFEIAQLIKLGRYPVKLNTMSLYLLESRPDSATFRVNFYRYRDGRPAERIIEKSIVQRKAITKGWQTFDLSKENIRLSGDVVAALEFLPDRVNDVKPISYEIKLGGTSKSFYRRSSLGSWNTPPHHYCLHVSGMVDREAPVMPDEDKASDATFELSSAITNTRYAIFVHLPADDGRDTSRRYPLVLHLDGNAYFDAVKDAVTKHQGSHPDAVQPILVGIGYENAYVMDSLRVRDYTFPEALATDSFATSGGAAGFYRFITEELIPRIDRSYRTQRHARTIMGHSFGGYFVLYALARQLDGKDSTPPVFNRYVSASPSIVYRDGYIVKRLAQVLEMAPPEALSRQKLVLTMGEEELEDDTSGLFDALKEVLRKRSAMQQEVKVYKRTDHMGTAIPSFEEAIKSLYE